MSSPALRTRFLVLHQPEAQGAGDGRRLHQFDRHRIAQPVCFRAADEGVARLLIAAMPPDIVFLGTGAGSYMNVGELAQRGIRVHTIKGYGDTAVAEHAIALMLACCRDIARMDREVRSGTWSTREGVQLFGKTLGVIGLGGIGREVLRIGRGLGMQVIAWNRTPRPGEALVALDELLIRSDVISLHLALNDDTRGFLGPAQVARMKPGVILVNTARGALIDEDALIDGLRSGRIRHAGLDVFHAEPLRPDHPIAAMDNVTLTAHAGFRTLEASMTLLRRAIDIVSGIVLAVRGSR